MKNVINFVLGILLVCAIATVTMDFNRYDVYMFESEVTESIFEFADENGITNFVHKMRRFVDEF